MRFLILLLMLAGMSLSALAQITAEIVLDQSQYLANEDIGIKVRVTNMSGRSLLLGKADWLKFAVERQDNYVVSRLDEIPVEGEFLLESSKVATKRVNLTPGFDLSRPGRYFVSATLRIPEWQLEVAAKSVPFEIVSSATLWEQAFGVPVAAVATANPGLPEMRKYALLQASYSSRLRLYFRLSDSSGNKVHKICSIAPMVSFGRPEAQVDAQSRLHVLLQTGAKAFIYSVFNHEGNMTIRQTIDYLPDSRPVLKMNSEGEVVVSGGQRRPQPDDLPVPEAPKPSTNAPAVTP